MIGQLIKATTPCAPDAHCWHEAGSALLTYPRQTPQVCCHCKALRVSRDTHSTPARLHGPYVPRWGDAA